jgi:hypothetical protein
VIHRGCRYNYIGGVLASVLASSVTYRGCRYNYISGVLASVLVSSVIDRGCRYNYIGGVYVVIPTSTMYHTLGEHTRQHTTDVVEDGITRSGNHVEI